MSTVTRTLRNLWKIGFKEYGHQIQYMVQKTSHLNGQKTL